MNKLLTEEDRRDEIVFNIRHMRIEAKTEAIQQQKYAEVLNDPALGLCYRLCDKKPEATKYTVCIEDPVFPMDQPVQVFLAKGGNPDSVQEFITNFYIQRYTYEQAYRIAEKAGLFSEVATEPDHDEDPPESEFLDF